MIFDPGIGDRDRLNLQYPYTKPIGQVSAVPDSFIPHSCITVGEALNNTNIINVFLRQQLYSKHVHW